MDCTYWKKPLLPSPKLGRFISLVLGIRSFSMVEGGGHPRVQRKTSLPSYVPIWRIFPPLLQDLN